jgi:hypothetical protein
MTVSNCQELYLRILNTRAREYGAHNQQYMRDMAGLSQCAPYSRVIMKKQLEFACCVGHDAWQRISSATPIYTHLATIDQCIAAQMASVSMRRAIWDELSISNRALQNDTLFQL